MPYIATRRFYNIFGKRIAKYFDYRKAKRLYNEISREMAFIESRILRSKLHHV